MLYFNTSTLVKTHY